MYRGGLRVIAARCPSMLAVLAAGAIGVPAASGVTVTFSGLAHGEIITNQFDGIGLTITADNPNRAFDIAAIFDSTETGTSDPDLEGPPWAGGNLPSDLVLENLLILAENNVGAGDGILDDPNDEASNPAGDLIFDFATPQTEFGFDLVDVDGMVQEDGRVSFFLDGGLVGVVEFSDLTDNGSIFFDPTIQFGNNTINRLGPFALGAFDRAVITLGGSGAVDNVNFIPSPGAAALLALGAGAAIRRRR